MLRYLYSYLGAILGLILLLSLLVVIIWWPVNDADCSMPGFIIPQNQEVQIHATKVVIQPWRGNHHVYGIFTIPDAYQETPFFILKIPGNLKYCSRPFGYSQNYDDVFAEIGTHLLRHYIRSRTAIKLILQGLSAQLNNPQNWILIFPKPQAVKVF